MASQQEILKSALKPDVYQRHVATPSYIKPNLSQPSRNVTSSSGGITGMSFAGFRGSYDLQSGSPTNTGGGPSYSNVVPTTSNMSTYAAPTISGGLNPYDPGFDNWLSRSGMEYNNEPNYSDGGSDGGYTKSQAELFNQQLENAYLLKQLGYNVDISGGQMAYSKADPDYLTPYGAYGMQQNTPVTEYEYLMQLQQANQLPVQQPPGNYRPYFRPSYNQSSYNGSYNRYYSGYGQRYYNNGYTYNRYNRYNRSKKRYNNRYNGYRNYDRNRNGYSNYNQYDRWY